jgi:hypothetical protein
MIFLKHRICFRLSEEQAKRYEPLLKEGWNRFTWTDLVRAALKEYWQKRQTSDNGSPAGPVSDKKPGARVRQKSARPRTSAKRSSRKKLAK